MKKLVGKILVLVSAINCICSIALGGEQSFSGTIQTTVDIDQYEKVEVEITDDAAQVLFNATAARTRIETVNDHLRRVVGADLTCYEHFETHLTEVSISYTCKFFLTQGGHIARPAQ